MRREFREQFDSTVVAHSTGADQGDPNAQPQIIKAASPKAIVLSLANSMLLSTASVSATTCGHSMAAPVGPVAKRPAALTVALTSPVGMKAEAIC